MDETRTRVHLDDLCAGLSRLGIGAGDAVFAHAAMSRLGYVEGGADTVLEALLASVWPGGTVAMPGYSFQLGEVAEPVFDVRETPCWASKVYETFRKRPGVFRSHHVTHSVCALGARARELTATHSVTPCGEESPFRKLAAWGATLLLIGVSHNANTTLHAVEEQEELCYVGYRELAGATLVDEEGRRGPLPSKVHVMSRDYDFNRLSETLDQEGAQRQEVIGGAIVRAVDLARMYELATAAVRRDPEALLRVGGRTVMLPVSAGGEGG